MESNFTEAVSIILPTTQAPKTMLMKNATNIVVSNPMSADASDTIGHPEVMYIEIEIKI